MGQVVKRLCSDSGVGHTDNRKTQELLGKQDPKTTRVYIQVAGMGAGVKFLSILWILVSQRVFITSLPAPYWSENILR